MFRIKRKLVLLQDPRSKTKKKCHSEYVIARNLQYMKKMLSRAFRAVKYSRHVDNIANNNQTN